MYAVPTDRLDQSYYFTIFYDTYFILSPTIVSNPLVAGGAGDFQKFSVRGGWEIFGPKSSRGGAEDFDEFGKNVTEKFSKTE